MEGKVIITTEEYRRLILAEIKMKELEAKVIEIDDKYECEIRMLKNDSEVAGQYTKCLENRVELLKRFMNENGLSEDAYREWLGKVD